VSTNVTALVTGPARPDPTRVRLVAFDSDGTLTDRGIAWDDGGRGGRRFDVRDGIAMQWAKRAGLAIVVPAIGDPGTRNASPTKKLATPMRIKTTAASSISTPRIEIPNGRITCPPPAQGKEEQVGNRSGAERRAQITPTGLCHSSTSPLLPGTLSNGADKTIPFPRDRRGANR